MRTVRTLLAVAVGAAALTATPALAWKCYGTENIGVVCYDTNLPTINLDGPPYEDCVIIANKCTVPISVPIPTVTPAQGPIVDVDCGGPAWQCNF